MTIARFCMLCFSPRQLDKSVLSEIATGDPAARNKSLIKKWCKTYTNTVGSNITGTTTTKRCP